MQSALPPEEGAIHPLAVETPALTAVPKENHDLAEVCSTLSSSLLLICYRLLLFPLPGRNGTLKLYNNNNLIAMTHYYQPEKNGSKNGGNAVFLQMQRGNQVCAWVQTHKFGEQTIIRLSVGI